MVAQLTVPKDIADSVRNLVESGAFPDTDTVLREAMQLLKDQQEEQRFLASIEEARRDHAEGRSSPSNDETWARIMANGLAKFEKGISPNPDVCPEY